MRQEISLLEGWQFVECPIGSVPAGDISSVTGWKAIDVPHDWLIYDSRDLYRDGEGIYRLRVNFTLAAGQRAWLRFDGVYMDTSVWVNSQLAGEWKYGYTPFDVDITDFITGMDDELVVRCVYRSPNTRWYSGAGLYRDVRLITAEARHILPDGVYISTKENQSGFDVAVQTETTCEAMLRHTAYGPDSEVACRSSGGAWQEFQIISPVRWDPENPALYRLVTEMVVGGEVTDRVENTFGLRTISFDPNHGFSINGRQMKLKGVCQHHDLGCLGAAFHRGAARRQLEILIEMGVNAIRLAHNPGALGLMELCDEIGMLVISEGFDMWKLPKTPFDYARFFEDWIEKDIAGWIRRDRNHPCVIMWSIGNEIYDTHADERGLETTRKMVELVRRYDPSGNAKTTLGSNYMPWKNAQHCAEEVDVVGYNYGAKYYAEHHDNHPNWVIYGSETCATVQSRGIYHFPLNRSVLSDDDGQCSSLGNSSASWGARSSELCIISDRDTPYSPGQFLWSGFDYIGEPTPYHSKNSFFGQVDTAGFKKDAFYIFQAAWTDYKKKPMVHLFPHWDFCQGQLIDVRACTNAPFVELFFHGQSLGRQGIDHAHGKRLLGDWQLAYRQGVIEAVAYDENGVEVARHRRESFSDAHAITLTPEVDSVSANGFDLCFLEISAVDKDGRPVENANNRIHVLVSGCGRLIGLDNGDSTEYDSYKGVSMRLFSGKLLAVIQANDIPGEIIVRASSEGLEPCEAVIHAVRCDEIVCKKMEENSDRGSRDGIPVRKIEIYADCTELGADQPTAGLRCELRPNNAADINVIWRVTDDAGNDSNLARIESNGQTAKVTALGDGLFRVRCATRNGGERIELYSQLEFTVSGLGEATVDPFTFVSGGTFTRSGGEIGNGNERGFASARDGESWVLFEHIDFGSFGSNELTIPIFCLDHAPFVFELWQGAPGEEGSLPLGTFNYQKPSIWNTYQEETFVLPRRLSGVTSLGMRFQRKSHIKGFTFTRMQKAFSKLYAADFDSLNGDDYLVAGTNVNNIGNNVTLTFDDMDFGEHGTAGIVVKGKTPNVQNTIQIRFTARDGTETIQLVEFTSSAKPTEQSFKLERVTGLTTVQFVFLPGSHFDFSWFQFLR
jgi:beta-galactosidase